LKSWSNPISFSPEACILLGEVVRPHGIHGLLRIVSYAGAPTAFEEAGRVYLVSEGGEAREFTVVLVRPHKRLLLMKLAGIQSCEEAEAWRKARIYVSKEALTREADEFFWHEVLGLEVYLTTGAYLGRVAQIIPTGSNDIYVVRKEGREVLVPAIAEAVVAVDLEARRMTVAPMEGLIDGDAV